MKDKDGYGIFRRPQRVQPPIPHETTSVIAIQRAEHLGRLHTHYLTISQMVTAIDPQLQLTFTVYSKPGDWDTTPTYAVAALKDA